MGIDNFNEQRLDDYLRNLDREDKPERECQYEPDEVDEKKVQSINFAEWISGEGYREYDGKDRWIAPHNNNNVYTTEQLYEMFDNDKF